MKIPQAVRDAVYVREGPYCLRCGQCVANVRSSIHHRKPRGMGGTSDPRTNDLRNLVLLCGSGTEGCHGHIESHRDEALADGWLIGSYDNLDHSMRRTDGLTVTWIREGAGLALSLAADRDRECVQP